MIPGIVAGFRAIPDSFPVYSPTPFLLPEVKEPTYDWASASGDTGATIPADASWDSTDYVVAIFVRQGTAAITTPSGFSLLDSFTHPTDTTLSVSVFGGFKGSASSFAFSWTGGSVFAAQAFALSNIDALDPIEAVEFAAGTYGVTADIVCPTVVVDDTSGKFCVCAVAGDANFSQDIKRGDLVKSGGVWASISSITRRIRAAAHPVAEEISTVMPPRWGCNLPTDAVATTIVLNRAGGTRPNPATDFTSVDTYLADFSVGYAWAAMLNGTVVESNADGWARSPSESVSPSVPFSLDTITQIGSVSKIVTELAIRKLVEDEGIDLDQTAAFYMGGSYTYGANTDTITLRQLLAMTSGVASTYALTGAWPSTLESWVGNAATNPGGVYLYQNGNFAMLQAVIEAVTGGAYGDYVQSSIFAPIGVLGAVDSPPSQGTLAYAQGGTVGGDQLDIPTTGAAGWFMSVNDMLKVARQFRKPTVISDASLGLMLNERFRLSPKFNARGELHQHDGLIVSGSRGSATILMRMTDGYDFVATTNTKPTGTNVDWSTVRDAIDNLA